MKKKVLSLLAFLPAFTTVDDDYGGGNLVRRSSATGRLR